jgi:hypothetical protein
VLGHLEHDLELVGPVELGIEGVRKTRSKKPETSYKQENRAAETADHASSLKGCNKPAQGNALGRVGEVTVKALKGRNKLLRPFRATIRN